MKEFVVRAHFSIVANSAKEAREQIIGFLEAAADVMSTELPTLQCSCVDNEDEIET